MILDEINDKTKERVAGLKETYPLERLMEEVEKLPRDRKFPFEEALKNKEISFICEVKKASPSKGLIASEFPYLDIAKEYEKAGAAAISVLTEPYFFQGKDRYLEEIKKAVSIPVLRKDFVVDEYMIYEAKKMGADIILLICAILTDKQLREYMELADSLGMSVLVEAHDEDEVQRALDAGARIIGVNNRDLRDFTVDINNSVRLHRMVPDPVLFVAESGIQTKEDVQMLKKEGIHGVLIGETLMRKPDKIKALEELRG
ncbi:indole-3-glycerol phosphate synthase TrpC [Parasporobacterium paucivorans]|uniref:Indole-3-glycerol phosphate synthase n=1 Tax=Parasporobacterium paucivorans DSM 15970 TaxID=1122934 RepID=A0A1M6IG72_9FIRM|nr:indole-3-glycerol phosphate synthase TrpC [Parasporobacterium paucivorans]SHJ33438.1 indole-3-glycerol phosphate synthase [Parasporobacterium paucivorans DSM 15970]